MSEEDKKSKVHRPEFVILEKEQPESTEQRQNEYFEALAIIQKVKPSLGLQIVILLSFVFLLMATLFVLFFFALNAFLAGIFLFQNKEINRYFLQSWKNLKKMFAYLAGGAIGLFSPSLGLGLIVLYFMHEKEPLNQAIMSRFNKPRSSN